MRSLPFKDGLDEWKKTQESIELARAIINPPKQKEIIIPCEKRNLSRCPERVIHGEVSWKPIDKQSALLLSKAPWWAHPIPDIKEVRKEEKLEQPKKKKVRRHKIMTTNNAKEQLAMSYGSDPSLYKITPGAPDGGLMVNSDEMALRIISIINAHPQRLTPLARAAVDARNVLHESMEDLGSVLENFQSKSKIMLEDIRQTRFSMVNEINHMNKELKELRQFFLGSDYKEEISRLKEFVELCERLHKLKQSGMLDAIGDTMIKLSQ